MPNLIRASGLMLTELQMIDVSQTLGEAMAMLRDAQRQPGQPNALMVVDQAGMFRGMLTAKLLIRALVNGSREQVDDDVLQRAVRDRLDEPVADHLEEEIPVVCPDDRLLTIVRRGMSMRLDFVPVVAAGRPVGVVPITAVFQAAAALALTPEHEGIRFPS